MEPNVRKTKIKRIKKTSEDEREVSDFPPSTERNEKFLVDSNGGDPNKLRGVILIFGLAE